MLHVLCSQFFSLLSPPPPFLSVCLFLPYALEVHPPHSKVTLLVGRSCECSSCTYKAVCGPPRSLLPMHTKTFVSCFCPCHLRALFCLHSASWTQGWPWPVSLMGRTFITAFSDSLACCSLTSKLRDPMVSGLQSVPCQWNNNSLRGFRGEP